MARNAAGTGTRTHPCQRGAAGVAHWLSRAGSGRRRRVELGVKRSGEARWRALPCGGARAREWSTTRRPAPIRALNAELTCLRHTELALALACVRVRVRLAKVGHAASRSASGEGEGGRRTQAAPPSYRVEMSVRPFRQCRQSRTSRKPSRGAEDEVARSCDCICDEGAHLEERAMWALNAAAEAPSRESRSKRRRELAPVASPGPRYIAWFWRTPAPAPVLRRAAGRLRQNVSAPAWLNDLLVGARLDFGVAAPGGSDHVAAFAPRDRRLVPRAQSQSLAQHRLHGGERAQGDTGCSCSPGICRTRKTQGWSE